MPPNAGDINFLDLEATFGDDIDVRNIVDPKHFLAKQHADPFSGTGDQICLTVKHLVEGLIEDSHRTLDEAEEKETECETRVQDESVDGYWDWKEEKEEIEPVPSASKEVNKKELLERILLEEEIRQMLTVSQIEKRLVEESERRLIEEEKEYETCECVENSDEYWNWSGETGLREEIRQSLTVSQLEKGLVEDSERRLAEEDSEHETSVHVDNVDGYWDWKEEEKEEVNQSSSGVKAVNKEDLLKRIMMEEEIRHSLMVERVEKSLVEESNRRLSEQVCEYETTVRGDDTSGFWDW